MSRYFNQALNSGPLHRGIKVKKDWVGDIWKNSLVGPGHCEGSCAQVGLNQGPFVKDETNYKLR